MKKTTPLCALLLMTSLPAYAGHGSIRETDSSITVEYSGDADDRPARQQARPADSAPAVTPDAATDTQPSDGKTAPRRGERQRGNLSRRPAPEEDEPVPEVEE